MTDEIPNFPYHPDPFASGVVVGADEQCECCERRRTLFYAGPFYAVDEIEKICLWCVADGSAASKWNGEFVDGHNFVDADIPARVVDDVTLRTPSYHAWQQEQWLSHCGDACEYHGYPKVEELKQADPATKTEWAERNELDVLDWDRTVDLYERKLAGFYKFKCRGCELTLYANDFS